MLVNGVPSMHICLDFIPKLLTIADVNTQVFTLNLISALCSKYPIIKTYNIAKLAVNVIFTLIQGIIL